MDLFSIINRDRKAERDLISPEGPGRNSLSISDHMSQLWFEIRSLVIPLPEGLGRIKLSCDINQIEKVPEGHNS
jgi:hypothetical protein